MLSAGLQDVCATLDCVDPAPINRLLFRSGDDVTLAGRGAREPRLSERRGGSLLAGPAIERRTELLALLLVIVLDRALLDGLALLFELLQLRL